MHSFFTTMPSKIAVTMPYGTGAFLISTQRNHLIHLIINQFKFIMKKKVFSLMMMLLLAVTGYVRAEELTVHDGTTTNSYVPVYGFYADAYLKCEMVYPASELSDMNGGTISALTFYTSSAASAAWTSTWQVFVSEVSSATISSFAGPGTVVYEGALDGTGATMTINFSTPYQYNGGNLLVGVYNITTGNYKSVSWYGETVTGASVQGYDYNSLSGIEASQRNFLPKTTFTYTPAGGGGGGGGAPAGEQIFAVQDGEIVDTVYVGTRPNGYWMEPFTFQIRNTGAATTITNLDWTPQTYFTLVAPELPVQIARDEDIDVQLNTGSANGNTEWQMVALYGDTRTAAIWTMMAEPYDPEIPDVWELAYDLGTIDVGYTYEGIPSQITPTELHDDYNLPFTDDPYNIPDGVDGVYKFTVEQDVIIDAYVDPAAENGKVALYREGFEGEGGPMATNYYTGLSMNGGGGAAAVPFEAQIGDGTSTTGYLPFYCFYNFSMSQQLFLAAELAEAGVTGAPMTSLSWYCTASNGNEQTNITIWMANVEETAIGGTSMMTAGMSKVYTGNMTPTANAWNEFVFNQGSFAWDGHSNILVSVQRNNGAWASGISWQCGAQSFTAGGYSYNDSQGAYNMETTSYTFGTSGSSYGGTTTNRANIIFKANGRGNRDAILTEGFESGDLNGWTLANPEDGTGVVDEYAHTGVYSFSFNYTSNPPQYLISPMLTGTENGVNVSFFYIPEDQWVETFEVGYSTTTNDIDAFTFGDEITADEDQDNWLEYTGTFPAGTKYIAIKHTSYDSYYLYIDDITITAGEDGGETPVVPVVNLDTISAGPVIAKLPLTPGTYYLVASATQADYTVYINVYEMPCPLIEAEDYTFGPSPADNEDEIEPASVTLHWNIPEYATGWRLVFGSTYYPEPNQPQPIMDPEDGSFTNQMANSYTVRNLWNNTHYFWHVEFNNGACPEGVSSPVWGFTTHLNVPQNLTAVDETVFNDEQIVLNWNAVVDRTYRFYNVYRDEELIGHTDVNDINNTTYTDGPLAYNMEGYTYYVTAVYDEGESAPSDPVNVKVSGYGDVNGHVYEQDGTTGIANATVTMVGDDEFGVSHTYNFTTDSQGYYSGHIYAGHEYNGSAACNGYQSIDEPVQGNPIDITYNETTSPIDYILDESFDPVCGVIAEYYPDSLDPASPYVKVYWGCGLPGGEIIEDFETGDFSMFDWQLDNNYPWSVTTNNPYEGTYCMVSGGAGVASVVSNMTVTV